MKWHKKILRHIFPDRFVWVEWTWGTINLYRLHRKGSNLFVLSVHDDVIWLKKRVADYNGDWYDYQSSYVKQWAPYRAWWQEPLPKGPDPDDKYKIKINERARSDNSGCFPPP